MNIQDMSKLISNGEQITFEIPWTLPCPSYTTEVEIFCPYCRKKLQSSVETFEERIDTKYLHDNHIFYGTPVRSFKISTKNTQQVLSTAGFCQWAERNLSIDPCLEQFQVIVSNCQNSLPKVLTGKNKTIRWSRWSGENCQAVRLSEIRLLDVPVGYCAFYHRAKSPTGEAFDLFIASTNVLKGYHRRYDTRQRKYIAPFLTHIIEQGEKELESWIRYLKTNVDYIEL